ncbi:MAG TPA: hypothetical protein VMX12_06730 [Acidimicrobiia bacterium]|nr:hypothetical protein [Acidimicrobiia bacterium]
MVTVLSGAQAGLTVEEIQQIVADNWGFHTSNTRQMNMVRRMVNRALRQIANHNPKLRIFLVHDADVTLVAGVTQYDVRALVANGGWGWDNCQEVLEIVIPELDDRPLEKLTREQFRERSNSTDYTGTPEAWFPIDQTRVRIFPTPASAYTGKGDYNVDIPSITTGQLAWPRMWDEAIVAGVEWLVSKNRMRDQPAAVREYERTFYKLLDDIEVWEKTTPVRPSRVTRTRAFRSKRGLPRDNSRDTGHWR